MQQSAPIFLGEGQPHEWRGGQLYPIAAQSEWRVMPGTPMPPILDFRYGQQQGLASQSLAALPKRRVYQSSQDVDGANYSAMYDMPTANVERYGAVPPPPSRQASGGVVVTPPLLSNESTARAEAGGGRLHKRVTLPNPNAQPSYEEPRNEHGGYILNEERIFGSGENAPQPPGPSGMFAGRPQPPSDKERQIIQNRLIAQKNEHGKNLKNHFLKLMSAEQELKNIEQQLQSVESEEIQLRGMIPYYEQEIKLCEQELSKGHLIQKKGSLMQQMAKKKEEISAIQRDIIKTKEDAGLHLSDEDFRMHKKTAQEEHHQTVQAGHAAQAMAARAANEATQAAWDAAEYKERREAAAHAQATAWKPTRPGIVNYGGRNLWGGVRRLWATPKTTT